MADEPKLAIVKNLDFHSAEVLAALEYLLERARAGEIKSVALAWETPDGLMGHKAAFGQFASRDAMVGRLQVLAQHIVLNDLLEWNPDSK